MNKLLLTGILVIGTVNSVFAQQWVTNGDHINNTNVGSVVIGGTTPAAINSAADLFPGAIPKFNIVTGQGAAPYTELVTLYHPGVNADAVQRQMGFLMKLSSESTTGETKKMGGMILESSNGYANIPSLSLVTGNARRLSIDYYGNVGIGTTTPTASLEVNGGGRFTGSNPLGGIGAGIEVYYNTNGGFFQTFDRAASTFLPLSIQGSSINFSNSGASISNPSLIIKGGNVGVTTTDPVATFQVNGGFSKLCAGRATGANLFYGTSYIGFNAARTGTGSTATWTIDGDSAHNGGGVIYGDVFGNIYLAPLPSDGAVQRTLSDIDIKSKITFKVGNDGVTYAKAISVQTTGWPDYVFKKAYKLPELNYVKQYIAQNQHLPEMPSAQQIEKDGMNVGEMNKLLLKKVEELTLYLIEKEKQLKEQAAAIQRQDNRLKKLERMMIAK